jgi:uncharacterized membrane protein YgcG
MAEYAGDAVDGAGPAPVPSVEGQVRGLWAAHHAAEVAAHGLPIGMFMDACESVARPTGMMETVSVECQAAVCRIAVEVCMSRMLKASWAREASRGGRPFEEAVAMFDSAWQSGMFRAYFDHLRRVHDVEVSALRAQPFFPGGTVAGAGNQSQFRLALPDLPGFSGVSGATAASLRKIVEWVERAQNTARLGKLPDELSQCRWAVSHLRGKAQAKMFATLHADPDACSTFAKLQSVLIEQWIGSDPVDVIRGDMRSVVSIGDKRFKSFADVISFFTSSVSVLKQLAPAGRLPNDAQLVDEFLLILKGSRYHEGVVLDPDTKLRPATLARAIKLAEDYHITLCNKNQGYVFGGGKRVREADAFGAEPSGAATPGGGESFVEVVRKHRRASGDAPEVGGASQGAGGRGGGGRGGGGSGGGGRGGRGGRGGGGRGAGRFAPSDAVIAAVARASGKPRDEVARLLQEGKCVTCGGQYPGCGCPRPGKHANPPE